MNPLSRDIIKSIKKYFKENKETDGEAERIRNERYYKGPETLTNDYKAELDGRNNGYVINGMIADPSSTEMVTLHGGGHGGVYFNYVKEGNTFSDFWMTAHVKEQGDGNLWTKHEGPTTVKFEFRKNMTSVKVLNRDGGAMNYNANVSFSTSDYNVNDITIGEHYIFLKGGPYTPLHISNLSFS